MKNLLDLVLSPIGIIIILLIIGSIMILLLRRKWGIIPIILAILALLAFTSNFVVVRIASPLINKYSVYTPEISKEYGFNDEDIKYIVVLEGTGLFTKNLAMTDTNLDRLIGGILLYFQHPGSKIVLASIGDKINGSPKLYMKGLAVKMGVKPEDVILEDSSTTTYENALMTIPIVQKEPFLLVTSSYHINRAMYIFKELGMNPIPAPIINGPPNKGLINNFPERTFFYFSIIYHEYLGLLYARFFK